MMHPALDLEALNRCLSGSLGARITGEPIAVFASYQDAPDLRVTAGFPTDSKAHPEVVVKANLFSLLSDSAKVHVLTAKIAPDLTPRVLGVSDDEAGSILILERFEGQPAAEFGIAGLEAVAKSLARIQLGVALEDLAESQIHTTSVADLRAMWERCRVAILSRFVSVWKPDVEGKLSKAFCGPIDDIPGLIERVESLLPDWLDALHGSGRGISIHHGDLHAGNAVILPNGDALIYDWETGSLAHPFLSMEKLLTAGWGLDTNESGGPWGYVRNTPSQDRLKAVYLEAFDLDSREAGRAFDAAMGLATIYEIEHEMVWARACGWANDNPEWTAQLLNRLREHISAW